MYMFFVVGENWRKPKREQGEHAPHTKALPQQGIEPRTFLL